MSTFHSLSQYSVAVLAKTIREGNERDTDRKGRRQSTTCTGDMVLNIGKPKDFTMLVVVAHAGRIF